jgi:hypothetical protein
MKTTRNDVLVAVLIFVSTIVLLGARQYYWDTITSTLITATTEVVGTENATTNNIVQANIDTGNVTVLHADNATIMDLLASRYSKLKNTYVVSTGTEITSHSDNTQTGSLAWCVTQLGGNAGTIIVPPRATDYTFNTAYEIPSNVKLVVTKGVGLLAPENTIVVDVNGTIEAGEYEIFGGLGEFDINTQSDVQVAWWGGDNASIEAAWDAVREATVHLTASVTYSGNVNLTERTYRKTLDGHNALIDGDFVVRRTKFCTFQNLRIDGHGELQGGWNVRFKNIVTHPGGGPYAVKPRVSGYHWLLSDSDNSTQFGAWWNEFDGLLTHGIIIAPGLNDTTTNNGVNLNRFVNCRSQGALTNEAGDETDNDNASVRVTLLGTDTVVNSQNNIFEQCELSRCTWIVKNGNPSWPVNLTNSYLEVYSYLNEGPIVVDNCYS